MVLANYVKSFEGGKVTGYAAPAGRITILTEAALNDLGYSDFTKDNWYYDAVAYVTENKLVDGLTATTFGPGEGMTRVALATALYRMAGSPEVTGENPFTDVADDAAYKDAVIWAYENKVITGRTETTFDPEGTVLRQEIAAMLYRYKGAEAEADLSVFTDADTISAYATDAMSWMVSTGLFQGNADGTIAPRATATRAQVATILMRFADLPEAPAEEAPAQAA